MPETKPKTFKRTLSLILAYLMFCIAGGAVATGLFLPGVFGANAVTKSLTSTLKPDDLTFDLSDLPQQSRMYASDGKTVIATFYDQNRIIVPLKDISDLMQKAVVAREDHRFWEHTGIDPQGIARAFVQTYVRKGDTQGGSTLTQQYVKNILIDQAVQNDDPIGAYHAQEETIARKLREMLIAVELEKKYSKEEILQGYLNIAQFGTNVYGVETAAEHYFSKSAKDLTLVEAATIAAITKNPSNFDPTTNPEEAQKQRNITLDLMSQWGFVDKKDTDAAKQIPIADTLHVKDVAVGCAAAGNAAYFCDYALHQIENSKEFGATLQERRNLIRRGGLNIYTTLDLTAQNSAQQAVEGAIPVTDPSGYENIIAAVRPGTGEVLALAQNRVYDVSGSNPYGTSLNYAVDKADGGSSGFPVGSTWKPFNFVAWLQAGHSMNEALPTSTRYAYSSIPGAGNTGYWDVQNAGGGTVNPETPLHGLNMSHNTVQASIAQRIGMQSIANAAKQLGYHEADGTDVTTLGTWPPSMLIGILNSSPLTMANAYATIAANGVECTPIALKKVTNSAGKEYSVPSADCHQAIAADIAQATAYAMNLNVTRGIASNAQLANGRKTFAKTGTNEQSAMTTGGFVPQVSAFVVVANAENPSAAIRGTINGVYHNIWYGDYIALPTWRNFMNNYLTQANIPIDNNYGNADAKYTATTRATTQSNNSGASRAGNDTRTDTQSNTQTQQNQQNQSQNQSTQNQTEQHTTQEQNNTNTQSN